MEDKIKLLETKLKLTTDILNNQNNLIYNIRELATAVVDILNTTYDQNSESKLLTHNFNAEQRQVLEDLIYTAKAKDLTSQRTKQFYRDYAREIQIKQEILDGL